MEKLSLEKFQDEKLEKKQMKYVHAGDCTGGGVQYFWDHSGEEPRVYKAISWSSDETSTGIFGHTITHYAGLVTTTYHNPALQPHPSM